MPVLSVPSLASLSDLIILGDVKSVHKQGAGSVTRFGEALPAHVVICEIEVSILVKGTVDGGKIEVSYLLPDQPVGFLGLSTGYQMLFLKKTDSNYGLASPYHPSLPAVPVSLPATGDELAKIATLLGAVVQSSDTNLGSKQVALYALSTIRNSESTRALQKSLEQPDDALRLGAAGFLLLRNDLSGLDIAEKALTQPGSLNGNILHNLDYAVGEGVKDDKAIPVLSRLARVPELETRRSAASALKHTVSKEAIPSLTYLLRDPDIRIRHNAVVGLAEITGETDWGPNLDLFESDEQKYIKHWREWALANGLKE
ncbi:MAG: HEAT repeat domain-containing protein [Candidatus Sulfotelmatobacter sp.]